MRRWVYVDAFRRRDEARLDVAKHSDRTNDRYGRAAVGRKGVVLSIGADCRLCSCSSRISRCRSARKEPSVAIEQAASGGCCCSDKGERGRRAVFPWASDRSFDKLALSVKPPSLSSN